MVTETSGNRLFENIQKKSQELWGERVVRLAGDKYRLRIRRDAYEFQSYAIVAVLAEDKTWTVLVAPDIRELPIYDKSYVAKVGEFEAEMSASLDRLEDIAKALL